MFLSLKKLKILLLLTLHVKLTSRLRHFSAFAQQASATVTHNTKRMTSLMALNRALCVERNRAGL